MYAMHVYIVNSRWGRDRVASDIYWHLSRKSIPPQNVIFTFVCCQILIRIPKHFFRCAAECVWCLRWVGATLHCLSAAKTRLCAAPQRTTAWNAVRQCALWLDEPGPPPSLELKIAGIEFKLADKQRGHELKQAAQNSSWRSLLQWIWSKTNMIVSNKTFSSKTIVDYSHGFFFFLGGGGGI